MVGVTTTLGTWPVSLGGVPLSIIARKNDASEADEEQGYSGSYETQESQYALERRDSTVIVGKSLRRGMGYIRRRSEDDDDGFAWGENVFTHFEDGARPAGRRQSFGLSGLSDGGAALNNLRFTHTAEFDGHLFWATDGGCIVRIPNGDPAQTPVYDPALNAFGSATRSLRASYNAFQLMPFEDDAGVSCLYLGATASGVGSRMYEKTSGGGWAESSAFASVRLERFAVCWWQDETGVGADRLHTRSSASHEIRHCIKGEDPMQEVSWITPISVGTAESQIQELIAGPRRLIVVKTDGPYDVTPFRAPALTSYGRQSRALNQHAATLIGRIPAILYDEHVYWGAGLSVDRYDLRLDGQQQRVMGACAPWTYAQDGFPIRGWPTAFAEDEGGLLLAIWNPELLTSYVVRGFDARKLNIASRNPIIWHGAEVVIAPSAGVGRMITRLHVGSPAVSSGTALQSIKRYLWMGCLSSAGGAPTIEYAELPNGGGPLSLAMSGGSFAHAATGSLYHTGQNWGDDNANKAVRRIDAKSARASSSNSIAFGIRADADPTTASGYQTEGTITSDSTKILPATVTSGRFIQTRLVWTVASPYTTAAVAYELRLRAKVIRETFQVRYLDVVLERDHEIGPSGNVEVRDPDAVFDAVMAFQDSAQVAFVDEKRRTYQVLVEQGVKFSRAEIGDGQWRTVARLEVSIVSGPA